MLESWEVQVLEAMNSRELGQALLQVWPPKSTSSFHLPQTSIHFRWRIWGSVVQAAFVENVPFLAPPRQGWAWAALDCIRKHANSGKVWSTCELCYWSEINNPVQNLTAQLKQSFWRDWTWIVVLWLSLKYFIAVLWYQGVNYGAVKTCNVKVLSFAYVQNINNDILVLGLYIYI